VPSDLGVRVVDRRGWTYLAGAAVASLIAVLTVPLLCSAVLAAAAAGAWATKQRPLIRWTLTLLAAFLIAALVFGIATASVQHGSHGGPITRRP
jgi:hypothetical protein